MHGLKFQSVALPNSLIGDLYGPVEGRCHDAGMLKNSGLLNDLSRVDLTQEGISFVCMGIQPTPFVPL